MSGAERRQAPRLDHGFLVSYRCPQLGQTEWMRSPIKDLSLLGIRFIGDLGYPVGVVLEMRLSLPTVDKPVEVMGQVMWERRLGSGTLTEHGLLFLNLASGVHQQVKEAIEFFLRKDQSGAS